MTRVLTEPFDSLSSWTFESGSGTASINPSGRTGSCLQYVGLLSYLYTIPTGVRTTSLTLGFAIKLSAMPGTNFTVAQFRITTATDMSLRINSDGSVAVMRGTTTAVITSATGLITTGTWYYIEFSVFHKNTGGSAALRINGTSAGTFSGDTNNGFNDTDAYTAVSIQLSTGSSTLQFDDLYINNDLTFDGPLSITSGAPALKYWDAGAWQTMYQAQGRRAYRQAVYSAKDDATTIHVNATSYGAFTDPLVDFYCGSDGTAMLYFYAQIGLNSGSDLVVSYQVTRVDTGAVVVAADDNNSLYAAPAPTPASGAAMGPGFISGTFMLVGLPVDVWCRVRMHYRVSLSTTDITRRRMSVMPQMFTIGP